MTPEEIEALGYGLDVIWQQLEQEVMNDVARRIKETGVVTRTADYQLNQIQSILGYSDQKIKEQLKDTLKASDAYINRVFEEAVNTDYIDNKKLYQAASKSFTPYAQNKTLQRLVNNLKAQSKEEMKNYTRSLGFVIDTGTGKRALMLSDFYQRMLDDAIVQIASGSFDAKTALRRSVSQMTNSGLRWIDYESGHHNRVTVAARRSITTGLSQMTQKISEYNGEQLGTEYFEVAWHANARPTHREWHGQVWSKQELETVCGLGTVEGLCGANCYHVYYPFIKGLSKRNWSDEWLKEQNEKEDTPITFNGKEYTGYEATQRQRVIETRMRAQREAIQALQEGDGDLFDIMCMQAKYRASMDEYVKFSKVMGLREQRDRIYADGKGKLMKSRQEIEAFKERINSYVKATGIVIEDSGLVSIKLSDHIVRRALSRNISADQMIDALTHPLDIGKIRVDKNGWSQKIIGAQATVVINPGDGTLITVHPTSKKRAAKLITKKGL